MDEAAIQERTNLEILDRDSVQTNDSFALFFMTNVIRFYFTIFVSSMCTLLIMFELYTREYVQYIAFTCNITLGICIALYTFF